MNDLPVTQSGSQNDTRAPQSSTSQTSVQPGTTDSLLNASTGGIQLSATPVSTVALPGTASVSTAKQIDSNGGSSSTALTGISIFLFVIAAVLFYVTSRPAPRPVVEPAQQPVKKRVKKTTK